MRRRSALQTARGRAPARVYIAAPRCSDTENARQRNSVGQAGRAPAPEPRRGSALPAVPLWQLPVGWESPRELHPGANGRMLMKCSTSDVLERGTRCQGTAPAAAPRGECCAAHSPANPASFCAFHLAFPKRDRERSPASEGTGAPRSDPGPGCDPGTLPGLLAWAREGHVDSSGHSLRSSEHPPTLCSTPCPPLCAVLTPDLSLQPPGSAQNLLT